MALNLAIYDKLGGAKKIISDYFEEILKGFSLEEKVVINEILAPMITYFYTKQRISYEQENVSFIIDAIKQRTVRITKDVNTFLQSL